MGKKRLKGKSRTFVPKSFLYEVEKEAKLSGRSKTDVFIDLKNKLKRKKKDYRWGTKWFKV